MAGFFDFLTAPAFGGGDQQPNRLQALSAVLQDVGANWAGRRGGAVDELRARSDYLRQQSQFQDAYSKLLQNPNVTGSGILPGESGGLPTGAQMAPQAGGDLSSILRTLPPSMGMPLLLNALQARLTPPKPMTEYEAAQVARQKEQDRLAQVAKDNTALDQGSKDIADALTPSNVAQLGSLAPGLPWQTRLGLYNQERAKAYNDSPQGKAEAAALEAKAKLPFEQQLKQTPTPQSVGATQPPAGYRYTADGNLAYIPGGPADPTKGAGKKAPTEDQAKNTQLYQRTTQQLPIVLQNFDALASGGNQLGGMTGAAFMTSPEYQRADAALNDIAASYLYSVSGATANPGEVANLAATLRPRLGESKQSVADKKARVQQMVESIKTRANGGQESGPANLLPPAPMASAGWRIERVQ